MKLCIIPALISSNVGSLFYKPTFRSKSRSLTTCITKQHDVRYPIICTNFLYNSRLLHVVIPQCEEKRNRHAISQSGVQSDSSCFLIQSSRDLRENEEAVHSGTTGNGAGALPLLVAAPRPSDSAPQHSAADDVNFKQGLSNSSSLVTKF